MKAGREQEQTNHRVHGELSTDVGITVRGDSQGAGESVTVHNRREAEQRAIEQETMIEIKNSIMIKVKGAKTTNKRVHSQKFELFLSSSIFLQPNARWLWRDVNINPTPCS